MDKEMEFYICDCNSHGLGVDKTFYEEDGFVYFSMWRSGYDPRMSIWRRIKNCFVLLFKGKLSADDVILNREQIDGLVKFLKEDKNEKL